MTAHMPHYLTREQVAERFGVSPATIDRWRRSGRIPKAYRIGANTVRWKLEDIEAHEETFERCFRVSGVSL